MLSKKLWCQLTPQLTHRTATAWLWYDIELHAPSSSYKSSSWWGEVGNIFQQVPPTPIVLFSLVMLGWLGLTSTRILCGHWTNARPLLVLDPFSKPDIPEILLKTSLILSTSGQDKRYTYGHYIKHHVGRRCCGEKVRMVAAIWIHHIFVSNVGVLLLSSWGVEKILWMPMVQTSISYKRFLNILSWIFAHPALQFWWWIICKG